MGKSGWILKVSSVFVAVAWVYGMLVLISNAHIEASASTQSAQSSSGTTTTTTTTTTTIVDPGPPRTRIRRPVHLGSYADRALRAITGKTGAYSYPVEIWIAVKQRLTNGNCRWLRRSEWERRPCDRPFGNYRAKEYGDGWRYRLPIELSPSFATRVSHYVVMAKGTGNYGTPFGPERFEEARNKNRFEIRPKN